MRWRWLLRVVVANNFSIWSIDTMLTDPAALVAGFFFEEDSFVLFANFELKFRVSLAFRGSKNFVRPPEATGVSLLLLKLLFLLFLSRE